MLQFRVLGPVELAQDGEPAVLGGPKQRALLAMLLLDANEPVARDRLIDGLWGERLPPRVEHALDAQVSALRRTLAGLGGARLMRRAPGYALEVEPGALDLHRFEHLVAAGHEALHLGRTAEAAARLRDALAVWRGPALANVLSEPFAAAAARPLEERRLAVLEERIDADLALGQGAELVGELEQLVREHPLRERLLGELMLALYRAGRQADALAEIQAARHRLAADLGLGPGPRLRELEQQILRQDPRLDAPRRGRRDPPRRRRGPAIAVGAAATVGATVLAVVLALGGESSTTSAQVDGDHNRLVAIRGRAGASPGRSTWPGRRGRSPPAPGRSGSPTRAMRRSFASTPARAP